jgi:hypothetical protein
MIPLLPFVAGLVVGAAALSALRSERTRKTLNETGARLRGAAHTAEEGVRAAARSGLTLLRGAAAEKPVKAPARAKPAAKKPAAARPAAPKRAPRKAKPRKAEA